MFSDLMAPIDLSNNEIERYIVAVQWLQIKRCAILFHYLFLCTKSHLCPEIITIYQEKP